MDSQLVLWKDTTLQEKEAEQQKQEDRIIKEQDLDIFMMRKDYKNAIYLALELNHPSRLLSILKTIKKENKDESSLLGLENVDELIKSLKDEQLIQLLGFVRDWNTTAYSSQMAQCVLKTIFMLIDMERLSQLPKMKEMVQALIPYTERHMDHADDLLKQSYLIDYTLFQMQQ